MFLLEKNIHFNLVSPLFKKTFSLVLEILTPDLKPRSEGPMSCTNLTEVRNAPSGEGALPFLKLMAASASQEGQLNLLVK